jgi:tRNA 2-thiouridine synthesizing protein A
MSDTVLDAKGLTCPLPILRAKKLLRTMDHGDALTVIATDPSSVKDFQSFCRQTGNDLVEQTEDAEGIFRHVVRKVCD